MKTLRKMMGGANIPALRRERKSLRVSENAALRMEGQAGIQKPFTAKDLLGSFKRGGAVKRTGLYRLHKGEKVIAKKNVRANY